MLGLRWAAVWAGVAALRVALAGTVLWPGLRPSDLPVAFVVSAPMLLLAAFWPPRAAVLASCGQCAVP